jgi:hypothetical protein
VDLEVCDNTKPLSKNANAVHALRDDRFAREAACHDALVRSIKQGYMIFHEILLQYPEGEQF